MSEQDAKGGAKPTKPVVHVCLHCGRDTTAKCKICAACTDTSHHVYVPDIFETDGGFAEHGEGSQAGPWDGDSPEESVS